MNIASKFSLLSKQEIEFEEQANTKYMTTREEKSKQLQFHQQIFSATCHRLLSSPEKQIYCGNCIYQLNFDSFQRRQFQFQKQRFCKSQMHPQNGNSEHNKQRIIQSFEEIYTMQIKRPNIYINTDIEIKGGDRKHNKMNPKTIHLVVNLIFKLLDF